ncbi:MAG: hypothetical protein B6I18_01105 [Bacteroidetes bacterium 4572_112]|nr:MAG: hypothetical protein B6I18_01105 [Bacteroidetes bacterium 4572_112]
MENLKNISVAFIGSGNVATKLATSLHQQGVCISEVCSKTASNAQLLATKVNAKPILQLKDISSEIDIIIISISDKALHEINLSELPNKALICHTSGSVDMQVLNICSNYGVFYPLQTFSKDTKIDITEVPFCIEGNTQENQEKLMVLASFLSKNVSKVNSKERAKMHLAAVFTCNFTNAMYSIAEDLMQQSGLDFEYLRPLIKETATKAITHSPSQIQTGPAVRNDRNIINKHIQELDSNTDYKELYSLISKIIYKNTNKA